MVKLTPIKARASEGIITKEKSSDAAAPIKGIDDNPALVKV